MKKFIVKYISRICIVVCCCFVCAFCAVTICGCDKIDINKTLSDVNKASVTAYLSEVNAISKEFRGVLYEFDNNIKNNDFDKMKSNVDACHKLVDEFSGIEVPENCKDVQDLYSSAFTSLVDTLDKYVSVYSDFKNGQTSAEELNSRIAETQNTYNQAIENLKNADKLAADK